MAFEISELIDYSPELVWAVMTDFSQAAYWLGVEKLRPLEGDKPLGEGSRLIFNARGAGHVTTILRWEPHRALTLESTQGGITAAYAYTLEPQGAGTRVRLRATTRATGRLWRALLPLVRFGMARAERGQLRALKALTTTLITAAERQADALAARGTGP